MLLYGDIVKRALDQEALPILKDAVDSALTARFGEEWYSYFARAIMEGYADFKKIDAFVAGGKGKVIDAFDISAICYLVMPYDKDLKMYLEGAMPMIEEKFGLENKPERLKRIRSIQNNVSRKKFDVDMEENDANCLSGVQEKKWLTDIEATLQEFKPELSLESYFNELDEQIARRTSLKEKVEEAVNKRPTAEEVREAYTKILTFDFSDAPIGRPIMGKAPWAARSEELEKLPWPSAVKNAEKMAADVTDEFAQNLTVNEAGEASMAVNSAPGGMPASAAAPLQINLDDIVKPDPAADAACRIPGTAPNEDAARRIPGTAPNESADSTSEDKPEETKETGVGKLFGWLKGKK